jgi:ketosteroid isomerase-like protein
VSQENVEIAKRARDTYNTDASLSEYDALLTPDCEWITAMAGVENEIMRGREGVEQYYASLNAAWESASPTSRRSAPRPLFIGVFEA